MMKYHGMDTDGELHMRKLAMAIVLGILLTGANAETVLPTEMNPEILFENNNLGNCLACHAVLNHPEMTAGNIGPPFIAMKERFPDKEKLREIIYDEQLNNPDTIMPPFGRNKVLTKEQIDVIVDYILQF